MIGVGTALADNPQLTVRRVAGPNPARVILDPRGRLPPDARVLAADGTRRLVVTTPDAACAIADGVEVVRLAAANGHIAPAAVLAAVRDATPGTAQGEAAVAPFASGPWLFSHNGIVNGWPQRDAPSADEVLDAWEWYARALRAHA